MLVITKTFKAVSEYSFPTKNLGITVVKFMREGNKITEVTGVVTSANRMPFKFLNILDNIGP